MPCRAGVLERIPGIGFLKDNCRASASLAILEGRPLCRPFFLKRGRRSARVSIGTKIVPFFESRTGRRPSLQKRRADARLFVCLDYT